MMPYQAEGKCLLHLIVLKGKRIKASTVVKLGMCKHRKAVGSQEAGYWLQHKFLYIKAKATHVKPLEVDIS